MFKPTAIIVATVLLATSAYAQEAPSGAQRAEVRADLDKARAAGAWPVRESNDVQRVTVNEGGRKVQRRPRKEYPNVMGMSIHEWLASREVAAVDPAGAAVRGQ